MAFALLNHSAAVSSNGNLTTTLVMTGADLITVFGCWYDIDSDPTMTDNQGTPNTYSKLTVRDDGIFVKTAIWYANVNTGTFNTGASVAVGFSSGPRFAYLTAAAWSGSRTASQSYDSVQNGATTAGNTSLGTGSVTPNTGHNNALILTGLGFSASNTPTINGGFQTPLDRIDFVSGNNFGGIWSYLIQTTAAAASPTWSWSTSTDASTAIAVFRAADESGGGGRPLFRTPSLGGVGIGGSFLRDPLQGRVF